jgi:hypothetical protein
MLHGKMNKSNLPTRLISEFALVDGSFQENLEAVWAEEFLRVGQ